MSETTISEERVRLARHYVYWRNYRWHLDRADNAKSEKEKANELEEARAAQAILDLIGWPDDDEREVELDADAAALIRRDVIGGLAADAQNLADSANRLLNHPGTPVDWYHKRDFEDLTLAWEILDEIGWELS